MTTPSKPPRIHLTFSLDNPRHMEMYRFIEARQGKNAAVIMNIIDDYMRLMEGQAVVFSAGQAAPKPEPEPLPQPISPPPKPIAAIPNLQAQLQQQFTDEDDTGLDDF